MRLYRVSVQDHQRMAVVNRVVVEDTGGRVGIVDHRNRIDRNQKAFVELSQGILIPYRDSSKSAGRPYGSADISETFFAEVDDVDVSEGFDAAEWQAFYDAYLKHQVLVLHGQT